MASRAPGMNLTSVAAARVAFATAAFLIATLSGCGEGTPPGTSDAGLGGVWDGSDASKDSSEEKSVIPDGPYNETDCKKIVTRTGCVTRCGCANCPDITVACFLDPDCRAIVECAADNGCTTHCAPCDGVIALHPAGINAAIAAGACFAQHCGSACGCSSGCDAATDGDSDALSMGDADAAPGDEIDSAADGLVSDTSSPADGEGD